MTALSETLDPFSGVFGDSRGSGLSATTSDGQGFVLGWLQHLLSNTFLPSGIISLQGNTASGKSSLMTALAAELNQTAEIFYVDCDSTMIQDVIAAQPVQNDRPICTLPITNRDVEVLCDVLQTMAKSRRDIPCVVFIDSLEKSIPGAPTPRNINELITRLEVTLEAESRSITVILGHTTELTIPEGPDIRFVTQEVGQGNGTFVFETSCYREDTVKRVRCTRDLTSHVVAIEPD